LPAAAAVAAIALGVDAVIAALSFTGAATARAVVAGGLALTLLIAPTTMVVVVALGIDAAAAALFLPLRANALTIAALPPNLTLHTTAAAIVRIATVHIDAAATAVRLALGTHAAALAAHEACAASAIALSAVGGTGFHIDAVLTALGLTAGAPRTRTTTGRANFAF